MAKKKSAQDGDGDNTVHRLISFLVPMQEVTVPAVEYLCRRLFIANSFRRCGELQAAHRSCDFVTLEGD